MKRWFRKGLVVLLTILTLGIYTPSLGYNPTEKIDERKDRHSSKMNMSEDPWIEAFQEELFGGIYPTQDFTSVLDEKDYLIADLIEQANYLTWRKLGPRIAGQVEAELEREIIPAIEGIVQQILLENEDHIQYFSMTEHPTKGIGERIFHIYDERTTQDIVRFHVRRDHRPLEGYWFNFHYHLAEDNYEHHYDIGEIYWDKNVPPKWMT